MKKLLLILTLATLTMFASAQVALESLVTYKNSKFSFTQTVTYPLFTAENVFKTKFNAEIKGFVGSEINQELPPTFGGVAALRFPNLIARGIDLDGGLFLKVTQGEPVSTGLYFGILKRF